MPKKPDHATSAEKWLAEAERTHHSDPAVLAAIAQAHALLAIASYLGAARVRPRAGSWEPDYLRGEDEAAIDRARARNATEAERGMAGERPRAVIVDEWTGEPLVGEVPD